MLSSPEDISAQLRQRLTALLDQVTRDRQFLNKPHPCGIPTDKLIEGDAAYARLFDSLQNTLHNLNQSSADEMNPVL